MGNSEASRVNPLAVEPIGKLIVKFAVPSVISMVVNAVYNLVDQIFIGWGIGYLGNGATNVVFPMVVIAMAFSFLVGDGSAAYFSLSLGRGEPEKARKAAGNELVLLAVLGVCLTIFFLIFLEPILLTFGATPQVLPYAIEYGRIIVLGFPFFMVGIGLNGIIRVDGSPQYAMATMLTGAILNTILDPIAIFVLDWGVGGAALATIISQMVSCILGLLYLPKLKSIKTLDKQSITPSWKTIRTSCSLGVSSFISQVAGSVVIFVVNNALVDYGAQSVYGADIPLSAFGIVIKVNQIFVSVLIGLAVGAQPIVGYNYGAKNYRRVRRTYVTEIIIATITAFIGWCVFQFAPEYVVRLFGNETDLYNEFAVRCFRTFLLTLPIVGFQIGSSIFFQAIGKPVIASVLSLSRQILFLIPSVLILSSAMGVIGILWAGPTADSLSTTLTTVFVVWQMITLHRLIHAQEDDPVQEKK